jgi:hypothetical protein
MSSPAAGSAPGAAGATGTTGATAAAGSATGTSGSGQTYRLIANPSALTEHVGKKLELTGVIEDQKGAATGTETAAADGAAGPAFRVQSGKIVADSCTP